jgi:hypothetical protein
MKYILLFITLLFISSKAFSGFTASEYHTFDPDNSYCFASANEACDPINAIKPNAGLYYIDSSFPAGAQCRYALPSWTGSNYIDTNDACDESCPAGFIRSLTTGLCEVEPVACVIGATSADCPATDCPAPYYGSVGWGMSCPEQIDESDYGCITSGAAHQCDPDYPTNGTGEGSSTDGTNTGTGEIQSDGTDGQTRSNITSGETSSSTDTIDFGTTSGSTGSNTGQLGTGTPSTIPTAGVNTPIADYCVVYPNDSACTGFTQVPIQDICSHGGAPDPVIGCDYNYNDGALPSTLCPVGQVRDQFGVCVTPPTITITTPPVDYVAPTNSPPSVYPPVTSNTGTGTDTTISSTGGTTMNRPGIVGG